MSKKQKVSPKVKHKAFASFSVKLQDQDWMIGIFNPNDKTAAYFLAEPTPISKNPPHGGLKEDSKTRAQHNHSGFVVSALSRQGLAESTITGLPRKFKAVEDAMEWLEGQVEKYDGDTTKEELVIANNVAETASDLNTGKKPKIQSKSKNNSKSIKTVKSDAPYVKPEVKFKTSKQELYSLGLGDLFQELPYK